MACARRGASALPGPGDPAHRVAPAAGTFHPGHRNRRPCGRPPGQGPLPGQRQGGRCRPLDPGLDQGPRRLVRYCLAGTSSTTGPSSWSAASRPRRWRWPPGWPNVAGTRRGALAVALAVDAHHRQPTPVQPVQELWRRTAGGSWCRAGTSPSAPPGRRATPTARSAPPPRRSLSPNTGWGERPGWQWLPECLRHDTAAAVGRPASPPATARAHGRAPRRARGHGRTGTISCRMVPPPVGGQLGDRGGIPGCGERAPQSRGLVCVPRDGQGNSSRFHTRLRVGDSGRVGTRRLRDHPACRTRPSSCTSTPGTAGGWCRSSPRGRRVRRRLVPASAVDQRFCP
jgi:hypothetical protein